MLILLLQVTLIDLTLILPKTPKPHTIKKVKKSKIQRKKLPNSSLKHAISENLDAVSGPDRRADRSPRGRAGDRNFSLKWWISQDTKFQVMNIYIIYIFLDLMGFWGIVYRIFSSNLAINVKKSLELLIIFLDASRRLWLHICNFKNKTTLSQEIWMIW